MKKSQNIVLRLSKNGFGPHFCTVCWGWWKALAKSKSISTNRYALLLSGSSWFVTSGPQKKKNSSLINSSSRAEWSCPGCSMALVRRRARAQVLIASLLYLLSFPLFFLSVFGLHFACVRPIFLKAWISAHCLRTLSFCGLEESQFRHLFSRKIQLLPTGRGVFFLSPLQSSKLELLLEPISDEERRRSRKGGGGGGGARVLFLPLQSSFGSILVSSGHVSRFMWK